MSLTERRSAQTSTRSADTRSAERAGTPPPARFSVDLLVLENETILTLHGELDLWSQQEFVTTLAAVGDDVERLILDLSDLTFIDASNVGIIHQRRTVLEAQGRVLVLRSPHVQLRRILEITGMFDGRIDRPQHEVAPSLPARADEHESISAE